MREIIVRAWDGDSETFFYSDKPEDDRFFEFDKGKLTAFILVETHGTIDEPPGMNPVPLDSIDQYTGLKDKNGKEIYEGDILKDNQGNIGKIRFGRGYQGEPADGIYPYDGWCFGEEEDAQYGNGTTFDTREIEVIGNIYENPELLK